MGQGGFMRRPGFLYRPKRQSSGRGLNERFAGDNGFTFLIGESGVESNTVFFADDFQNLQAQRNLIIDKDRLDKFECLREVDGSHSGKMKT
jgi:hypothetical protein